MLSIHGTGSNLFRRDGGRSQLIGGNAFCCQLIRRNAAGSQFVSRDALRGQMIGRDAAGRDLFRRNGMGRQLPCRNAFGFQKGTVHLPLQQRCVNAAGRGKNASGSTDSRLIGAITLHGKPLIHIDGKGGDHTVRITALGVPHPDAPPQLQRRIAHTAQLQPDKMHFLKSRKQAPGKGFGRIFLRKQGIFSNIITIIVINRFGS